MTQYITRSLTKCVYTCLLAYYTHLTEYVDSLTKCTGLAQRNYTVDACQLTLLHGPVFVERRGHSGMY